MSDTADKIGYGTFGIHREVKTQPASCQRHGSYESKCFIGDIWSKCPKCGEETLALENAEKEAKERELRKQAWVRRIGDAGIPERFRDRSLQSFVAENPGQERAIAFANEYADNFADVIKTGRSAVFMGKPGTGKTHIAIGIGLRIMQRQGRSVLFTTVMRAIRRVKDTWGRDHKETETQAIAALTFPDLLILDEVGVQFGSDTEKLILFDILNERYEKRRPTLLLSNLTLDEIKAYLGDRIFDRLREDDGEAIAFDWQSWRGRSTKEAA